MFLRTIVRSVLYPCLFGLGLFIWILCTQSGLIVFYGILKQVIPGHLDVATLKGCLIDTLHIEGIHYVSETCSFQANSITVKTELQTQRLLYSPTLLLNKAVITFPKAPNTPLTLTHAKANLTYPLRESWMSIQLENIAGTFKDAGFTGALQLHADHQTIKWVDAKGTWGTHQFKIRPHQHQLATWTWTHKQLSASGLIQFLPQWLVAAEGKLILPHSTERIALPGNQFYNLHYTGEITAKLNQQGLALHLSAKENPKNSVEGDILLPGFRITRSWHEQPLQGSLKGRLQDLSIAYLLAPAISRLKGNIELRATITGSLAKPLLHFNAQLDNSIFSIPKQRITLKAFSAHLEGNIPGILNMTSTGTLSGQSFFIKGHIDPLSPQKNTVFELSGHQLRIYNTPNIYVIASPRLLLRYTDNQLKITGDVSIPEAKITLAEAQNSVMRSNDVKIMDKPKDVPDSEPFYLDPNITLLIDEKLHFKGHGLDAIVGGQLHIERRLDGLYTGTGRLLIKEGKYRLQSSMGRIHKGRLVFPKGTLLTDPLLDIRISQKSDRLEDPTEVGIYVQGTLLKPIYHLYSSDHLHQTEILSRLGLGGTEIEGGSQHHQLLSQSAMLLSSGAHPFIERLQNKLGLEEIGIQSRTIHSIQVPGGTDSALVIGKALSNKLYLQFLQGMLEPISLLRLKYALTSHVAVSVEKSTEGIGTDLSFSLEKN